MKSKNLSLKTSYLSTIAISAAMSILASSASAAPTVHQPSPTVPIAPIANASPISNVHFQYSLATGTEAIDPAALAKEAIFSTYSDNIGMCTDPDNSQNLLINLEASEPVNMVTVSPTLSTSNADVASPTTATTKISIFDSAMSIVNSIGVIDTNLAH